MKLTGNFINGNWIKGTGREFSSHNPATGEILCTGKESSPADIAQAVNSARKSFWPWAKLAIAERKKYITAFADTLSQHHDDFAALISQETGKPLWEAKTEVAVMIKKVEISFAAYEERCKEESSAMGTAQRHTRYKPYGVVAVFGPFNLPGHLPNGHIIPALLAGNTVVFKPSEYTPLVGQKLVELWESTNLPKGVMNLVQGGKDTGVALSKSQDLDGLFFTGSSKTGNAIHRVFAGHPEKILALEMGGNNPLIVYDVGDLTAAAYLTIQSAFITAGQRCVCARRLIIADDKNGEEFLAKLIEFTTKIKVGSPTDQPEPFIGPVISNQVGEHLLQTQTQLQKEGGTILLPLEPLGDLPAMLRPGIMDVTNVKNRPDEEYFGPFLQVIRVADFDDAIREANQTVYGLSAGLLSDRKELYARFLQLSRAGIVNWNRQITGASSQAPFGGIGRSGNHQPSAYFAADYCAYPVASIEEQKVVMPESLTPGIQL